MVKYVLKRIGMAALTLLIIVFLLFWLVRVMPGNPFPSERMNDIQIANKRAELGLDNPILVQFWNYIVKLFHGDFGNGTSLYYGVPIKTVLHTAISNSFRIGGFGILLGTVVGLLLGITAALNRGRFLDGFCTVFSIIGVCVPSYVFLIFLQYTFSFKIPFFPYFFDTDRFWFSSIMPALSLSLFTMSTIARFTRNEMVEVFDSDYVHLAEAKGMYGGRLVSAHVLRNALIPIVTVIGLQFGQLIGGAVLTETIFSIPGIGRLMVQALKNRDYPVILGCVLFISVMFCLVNLVIDVIYAFLDPKIKAQYSRGRKSK